MSKQGKSRSSGEGEDFQLRNNSFNIEVQISENTNDLQKKEAFSCSQEDSKNDTVLQEDRTAFSHNKNNERVLPPNPESSTSAGDKMVVTVDENPLSKLDNKTHCTPLDIIDDRSEANPAILTTGKETEVRITDCPSCNSGVDRANKYHPHQMDQRGCDLQHPKSQTAKMTATHNDLSRNSDKDIENDTKLCSYDKSRGASSQTYQSSHDFRKNGKLSCMIGQALHTYKSTSSMETHLQKLLTTFLTNNPYRYVNNTLFTLLQLKSNNLNFFIEIFVYPCRGYLPISTLRIMCSCCVRMDQMQNRLRSLQRVNHFPQSVSIEDLANDGFYFCENNYSIQCYCCGMVPVDCRVRHSVHSPGCQHVTNLQIRGTYVLDRQNPISQTTENQIFTERESNNLAAEAAACASNETQISSENRATGWSPEDDRQPVRNGRSHQRQITEISTFSQNGRLLTNNADISSVDSEEGSDYCIINRHLRLETMSSRLVWQLRQENMRLRGQDICIICQARPVRVIFLPCGHLILCEQCSMAFSDCPAHRCGCRIQERLLSPASSS